MLRYDGTLLIIVSQKPRDGRTVVHNLKCGLPVWLATASNDVNLYQAGLCL